MNINAIKQIYNFNKEAGFLDIPYNHKREAAYPIEESLETFEHLNILAEHTGSGSKSPKDISRAIISLADNGGATPADVDLLDKHLDTIVFAFGSIFKLGLNPQQAMRGLHHVMNANMSKLSVGHDAEGKQQKPTDFVSPEAQLQLILDELKD